MNRLTFEDDVIREALMMDTDSNDDCDLVGTHQTSKQNTKESTVQKKENKNYKKINVVNEEFINKDMEEKRKSETKHQCRNCLQEFEKKELQNHDCGKKKRKSLVLSFHSNLSITSRLNGSSVRKSDIKNDTPKSVIRKSIDSSTSESNGKTNHKKSSQHDKNDDLNVKEQNIEINKSQTQIFYECPICFQHFTKKEMDMHYCKDTSCLTLKFSTSSSFNDNVRKYGRNPSKRVHFEDFSKTNLKIPKQIAQAVHKRDNSISLSTQIKQPTKSQNFDNENFFKHNQSIVLKNDTKRKKTKRTYSNSEKDTENEVNEPTTKKIKTGKLNNEINKSLITTLEGSEKDVNRIETLSQNSSTKKAEHLIDEKITSKNENSDHSKTVDPKSITQIDNNTIFGNEQSKVQPNGVGTSSNKNTINKIEELKSIQKSCIVVIHKIDHKQTDSNKRILRSGKEIVKSQTEEKKSVKESDKLPKKDKMSSESTDKMCDGGEKSSNNVNKNVISGKQKKCQINEREVLLEKEDTGCQNLVNKKAEVITTRNEQDGKTTTKETDQPSNEDRTFKNKHCDHSETVVPKSISQIDNNTIFKNENSKEQLNQADTSSNKNTINKIEELKNIERSYIIVLHKRDPKQTDSNKSMLRSSKEIVKLQTEENKSVKESDKLLKQDKMSLESTDKMCNRDEKSLNNVNKNVISEKQKKIQINERKVEKKDTGCQNLVTKQAEVVSTRNEQNDCTENVHSKNQNEAEGNQNLKNVNVDLTRKDKSISVEREKSINIQFSQEGNTETGIIKKIKRPGLQNIYKCRLCCGKYTKIKQYNHTCKHKVQKTKSKTNERQIVEKSDGILKIRKNDSQSKINITLLSRDNVKIVTVSNNAKAYEVNQGDISNYVHSDQISKQNEIKETTEQNIHKSSTETVSQTELCNISDGKAFEKEVTFDVIENAERIIPQHRNAGGQNSDVILKELSMCEENSKIQDNTHLTTTEQNIHKSSTETVSQSELCNISDGKAFEKEEVTFDVIENAERIIPQHRNADGQNSDVILKELSMCEENSKIQDNTHLKEPQKQNKNKNDNEIQLTNSLNNTSNPTEIENTILSQNVDHSYSITDVINNQSIDTINRENTMSTQDEHSYSVIEENRKSTYKKQDIENSTLSVEKDVIASNLPEIVGSEITILERKITASDIEITIPGNVGREVTIQESEITESENKITKPECQLILPEIVECEVTIAQNKGCEITIPESQITVPDIAGAVTNQNDNTTTTADMNIEHFRIESIGCETIISYDNLENELATQNEIINNNGLTLKDDIVSIDNVAQEIIIPALEEGITYKESEVVLVDVENYVAIATQIKDDCLLSIDNVEKEVIITDDISTENVGNLIVVTEIDQDVVTIQNAKKDNSVGSTEISMKNIEHTVADENLGNEIIITTDIQGNNNIATNSIKDIIHACSLITGLMEKKNKYTINRDRNTKTLTKNIEHNARNEKNEKVSVERLENEVFVSNYFGKKDSIKDLQTEAYVSTTKFNVEALEVVQTHESYISTQTKTKNVEAHDSLKEPQNETDVSTKIIASSDSINDTNISTQTNGPVENISNTIVNETEANQEVNMDSENNVLVQNELNKSIARAEGILISQSGQSEKTIPTNDEIETIIIISSENENKKNILLTQNEQNETVIIISKQKEISGDHDIVTSRVEEIGNESNKLSLTETKNINTKNDCKRSKTLIKDELKTNDCTCGEKIGVIEKEDSLSIETKLAAILNQTNSQNQILETEKRFINSSGTHKCDEKEDNILESQLAAILNQNESQNKMAVKQNSISSANNIKNDGLTFKNIGSPITNNQLLEILSTNVDDTSQVENANEINLDISQKENGTKTKCFRCSKEFTNRELTTHNCLKKLLNTDQNSDKIAKNMVDMEKSMQNGEPAENKVLYVIEIEENSESVEKKCKDHEIPITKCIRCFICSEVYDKTHKCSNIETETENNNISSEKTDINSQDKRKLKEIAFMKKNKYYFNTYILSTKNGQYQCKICQKEYTARKNLVRHIHKHEKDYDKERFKCSFCPKSFEYKASLKSHEACHAGETYSCNVCDKSFTRKSNLYTHKKLHSENETFSCDKCGKEYTSKRYLNNHPCFNTKKFYCNYCGKKYKQKSNLMDHLHTHAESKPYTCKFCNKKFSFRSTHFQHTLNCVVAKQHKQNIKKNEEETVNKNNQFTCKICSITLQNKTQLQKHEWRHENKYFFCNVCPKKFKSKHFLQLHLASHEELGLKRKKFDCQQCDRQFATHFGLKLHLNKHNGVKFSCPLCEKLFSTKLLLKTHEKIHTGETPFVCSNCKKAFNNRSNYNRHKKNLVCHFTPIET